MKENHKRLIHILEEEKNFTTASFLARKLKISSRSVKNYIAELNSIIKNLISSSTQGYKINPALLKELLQIEDDVVPQSPQERVNYIIKLLLMEKEESKTPINLYDLCDEMFVSSSTVKRDVNQIKKTAKEFELDLITTNDVIILVGSERNKRRLMSSVYYEEFERRDLSLFEIQKIFPEYNIEQMKDIVITKCKKYHYYVNGYGLVNLLLDIVIGIDRIRNDYTDLNMIPASSDNTHQKREHILTLEIVREIESSYHFRYNECEVELLENLLSSHLLRIDYKKIGMDDLEELVGKSCIELVDKILKNAEEYFFLSINNEELFIKLAMHIYNLLIRAKTKYINKNPLTDTIKVTCPLLFDCAVSMASVIRQETGYEINEDEISYIVLHIGSLLEMQESMKDKFSCVLLFPQYYDFATKLEEKINKAFGDTLVIHNVITSKEEISSVGNIELLISTIPLDTYKRENHVIINSFFTERDSDLIKETLHKLKKNRKREILFQQLLAISNPSFFLKNHNFKSKEEAIGYMMDSMVKEGYALSDYGHGVFDREKMSSTAFHRIAVPHSLKMNAKKTGMFILVNDKPLDWGGDAVNIVLLFTISKEGQALFRAVFDNLIVLLIEDENVNKVISCNNYQEFVESVMSSF